MNLLTPGFLWIAALAMAGLIVAHLFSRSRPRESVLPTARFVPEGAARAPTRARTPTDLVLLAIRAAMVALIGLAFARPVIDATRRDLARIFLVDASGDASDNAGNWRVMVDSIRALHRDGDVALVFDTTLRRAGSLDSLDIIPLGGARGSLSLALIGAMREAPELARRADSVELVLISPIAVTEVDSATLAIRAAWPGRIHVIRSAPPVAVDLGAPIELRASADDPLRAAIALRGGETDAPIRVIRDGVTTADSAWAGQDHHVLVVWPADRSDRDLVGRVRGDSIGAVMAGGRIVVAPFERRDPPLAGRPIGRWLDGAPAATEAMHGAGCIRSVAIPLPVASDLALRPEFGLFLGELLGPCGGRRDVAPAADSIVARIGGSGPLLDTRALMDATGGEARRVAWLLIAALLLGVLDQVLRRSRLSDDRTGERARSMHATGRST